MTLQTLLDRFDLLMDTPESVPKLRRFILRLALQGRLTEQRKEDIDVNTLIERLRTEKQRLYDEGEIRKPRSLDPLDGGEEWHQVPFEWKWTKVGEVGRIIGGSTPRTSNDEYWADQGIAWLTPGDLGDHDGKMVARGDRDISEKGLDSCSATLLPPGSVLFSSRAPIGYVAIAADELSTNQGFKSVRPYEMAMSHYIYWFLKYAGKRINDEASGTTFTEVSGTDLANIPFPLPPLEEQQRIVETVDGLMDECDALEEQQERERTLQVQVGTSATEALQSAGDVEALRPAWERVREDFDTVTATPEGIDALRKTILQLAVQGRLTERDPDDTPADVLLKEIQQEKKRLYDAGEIRKPKTAPPIEEEDSLSDLPNGWVWTRFTHLVINRDADRIPISKKNRADRQGKYPYYGASGIIDNIDDYTHEGTNLLIGEDGANLLLRSKPIAFLAKGKYWVNNHAHVLGATNLTILKYVKTFINATDLTPYVTGTAQAKLTQTRLNSIPVAVPPLREQKRIVETVDGLLPLCDDLADLLHETDEHGEQLLWAALRNGSLNTSVNEESVAKLV